ncbi:MAG: histidinol-phosphate transaminase [Treponema sp.]|jgi:histidinol-phosphate aminotransferase|nr:histidinol-phosphate transaminase [Treponema sp.]
MSKYWNQRTRALSPYIPGEQPRERKFIKLNTNENPYPPSPEVIAAIRNAANDDLCLYPDPECLELRTAIARRYALTPEQVFVGNGSDEILAFAFAAFFENGAVALPVLFPDITYSFYPVYARLWGTPFELVPLRDDFSLSIDDYDRPNGGVVIANPNAPTGCVLRLEDARLLVEQQTVYGRIALFDEAYMAFASEPGSLVGYINEYPNLLTVHTLSKAASLAGLRVGYAIAHAELIEGLRRVRDSFNSYTLDRLALAGATAAIRHSAYYDDCDRRIIATRKRVSTQLAALGFEFVPSSANFIFTRHPAIKGSALFEALRERGILTRRWDVSRIADYLRVSIGTDADMDAFLAVCADIACV